MSMVVFWVLTPRGLVSRYQRFGERTAAIFRADDGGSMFFQTAGIH
jgi:hypothetical protein